MITIIREHPCKAAECGNGSIWFADKAICFERISGNVSAFRQDAFSWICEYKRMIEMKKPTKMKVSFEKLATDDYRVWNDPDDGWLYHIGSICRNRDDEWSVHGWIANYKIFRDSTQRYYWQSLSDVKRHVRDNACRYNMLAAKKRKILA